MSRMGMFAFVWGKEPPGIEELADLVRHGEALGIDSVHVPWHMTLAASFDWENTYNLDPLVALPYLAARTERIGLALNPWTVSAHHPFHWAQFLASLHAVSGGRAISGLSKLFAEDDAKVGRCLLEDADADFDLGLQLVSELLAGRVGSAAAGRWEMAGLALDPAPASPIPTWISGGDAAAIRRAAAYGDVLKPVGLTPAEYAGRVRPELDAACADTGRSVKISSSVVVFVRTPEDSSTLVEEHVMPLVRKRLHGGEIHDGVLVGTPEECADKIGKLFAAGVDHLLLDTYFHGWESLSFAKEQLSRLAELVAPNVVTPGGNS